MIKLSDYVMDFLASKGVEQVFMLPGGGAMHLDDSLGRAKKLKYYCFLHEQALAIAAEAFGQHSNFPGVGLVTSGPGGTNTVTGVAAAFIDSTPCFFISGQAKRADLKIGKGVRQMGSQEVDIVSIVSCVTKYAAMVLEPSEIRYHLEKAWHLATTGRMGPVWLDIPLDVQAAMVDETSLKGFSPAPEAPAFESKRAKSALDKIVKLLAAAERPLVIAGNGVKLAGACDEMLAFLEKNQIPALLTWKMIDFLDYDHPLNFGCPGIMGCRAANFMVQNCDFLLVVGSRLDPSVTAFNAKAFAAKAKKAMVDIDKFEIKKIEGVDVQLVADAGEFLRALNARKDEAKLENREAWLSYCRRLKARYPVVLDEYRSAKEQVNLYVFTDELFKRLKSDDVIAPESSGAAGEATYQAMRVKKGQKIKNAAGLGSMGFGLPYSIGACLANGRRRTILINGDGAFQLNIQELETLKRLNLPIKIFIFDNNGYGSIMNTQRNMFGGFYVGSEPGSGLTLPDLGAVAKAYGLRVDKVSTHAELPACLDRVLSGDDPVLCVVKVAKTHVTAPKVQAMKLPDGGMVSKPLEDMWPYLSPEELASNMWKRADGK